MTPHNWSATPPQTWQLPQAIIDQLHTDWPLLSQGTRHNGLMWRIYQPALASVPKLLDTTPDTAKLIAAIQRTLEDDLVVWAMPRYATELHHILDVFHQCHKEWKDEKQHAAEAWAHRPDRDDIPHTIETTLTNLWSMTRNEYAERWLIAEIARIVYGVML